MHRSVVLTKEHLACHVMARPSQGRPDLEQLWLTPDGIVSTDGYRLLLVPYWDIPDSPAGAREPGALQQDGQQDGQQEPAAPGGDPPYGYALPRELVQDWLARPFAYITLTRYFATVLAAVDTGPAAPVPVVESLFARERYRQSIPGGDPLVMVTLNTRLFLDTVQKLARLGAQSVTLSLYGPLLPVVLEGRDQRWVRSGVAVLAPMRPRAPEQEDGTMAQQAPCSTTERSIR